MDEETEQLVGDPREYSSRSDDQYLEAHYMGRIVRGSHHSFDEYLDDEITDDCIRQSTVMILTDDDDEDECHHVLVYADRKHQNGQYVHFIAAVLVKEMKYVWKTVILVDSRPHLISVFESTINTAMPPAPYRADGRWYVVAKIQTPGFAYRPLVILDPHNGEFITTDAPQDGNAFQLKRAKYRHFPPDDGWGLQGADGEEICVDMEAEVDEESNLLCTAEYTVQELQGEEKEYSSRRYLYRQWYIPPNGQWIKSHLSSIIGTPLLGRSMVLLLFDETCPYIAAAFSCGPNELCNLMAFAEAVGTASQTDFGYARLENGPHTKRIRVSRDSMMGEDARHAAHQFLHSPLFDPYLLGYISTMLSEDTCVLPPKKPADNQAVENAG